MTEMASLTIRNLDDRVKAKLRLRAAKHGRSMEEEARQLLGRAIELPTGKDVPLGTAIRRRFASHGELKIELPPRGPMRAAAKFK
jgi:plasmid stability protein